MRINQNERRRAPRHQFARYGAVLDAVTSRCVGHLGDISTRGALVYSKAGFAPAKFGTQYLVLVLGDSMLDERTVSVAASKRWEMQSNDIHLFVTGFEFAGVGDLELLDQCIRRDSVGCS